MYKRRVDKAYKGYCKKKGLIISRQFETFAEEQLKYYSEV